MKEESVDTNSERGVATGNTKRWGKGAGQSSLAAEKISIEKVNQQVHIEPHALHLQPSLVVLLHFQQIFEQQVNGLVENLRADGRGTAKHKTACQKLIQHDANEQHAQSIT
jgi:hypothetical protein